ncbi:hypothetical protein A2U01_0015570, partial [Trifolium medium]|nr:hypothetical protein [Trifolium medium]
HFECQMRVASSSEEPVRSPPDGVAISSQRCGLLLNDGMLLVSCRL